jgi:CxxC motif-containing protein (DUF1111 family)
MHWQEEEIRFADGHVVRLRHPRIEFDDMSYGDIGPVLVLPGSIRPFSVFVSWKQYRVRELEAHRSE